MKVKLLCTLLFFISQCNYSQTIKGKVVFNNYAIPKVEVINTSTKTLAVSDANGEFSISAKTNDILVFVSKEHQVKKITINPKLFNKDELAVELILNAEELNEVVITNMPSIKLTKDKIYEQGKLDDIEVYKRGAKLRTGVYDGSIENGVTKIKRLFGSRNKALSEIEFSTVAKNSYEQKFYLENLRLQTDEIELFLQFCEADPKSKIVAANNNKLGTMDFLFAKNTEFKKLAALKK